MYDLKNQTFVVIAFAKFFIALAEDDNGTALEPIDEESPF